MSKLSFNTQLKFASYGIAGFLIPALAVAGYSGVHEVAVATGAIILASATALITGRDIAYTDFKTHIQDLRAEVKLAEATLARRQEAYNNRISDDSESFVKLYQQLGSKDMEVSKLTKEVTRLSKFGGEFVLVRRTSTDNLALDETPGAVKSVTVVSKEVREYATLSDANVCGFTENASNPQILRFNTQQLITLFKQAMLNAGYTFFNGTRIEQLQEVADVAGS